MVSINNDIWSKLKKEVDDYRDGKLKINFCDNSRKLEYCKYQQKIAESRRNYYPIRIGQVFFVVGLFSTLTIFFIDMIISIFRNLSSQQIILIMVSIYLIIAYIYCECVLINRFSKLQALIEEVEKRIQNDNLENKRFDNYNH